jgi:CIC family chloride channel protein
MNAALRRARLAAHPVRAAAALRAWLRRSEVGVLTLAVVIGIASGIIAGLMGAMTTWMHVVMFGPEAEHGLSALTNLHPAVLLFPAVGGLVLSILNIGLSRWWPRPPIDPIEANALYGGRMTVGDGVVVGVQNVVSNGFGASVGLEAAYAQAGGSLASRLGQFLGMRRADLRVLVGCGAAGAIGAAFNAPLTGAFYAFELIIGTYAIASLAPVMASAVVGTLAARLIHSLPPLVGAGGIGSPQATDYALVLLLGIICGLAGIVLMRTMTGMETLVRRAVPQAFLRPVVGGLAVGILAWLSPGALSAGHSALHFVLATDIPIRALVILVVVKATAASLSIGSGFRGGLFFASLLLGALGGKLFAIVAGGWAPETDPMLFAIVGTSAFGAAVIGAPLAMTFLALEATRDFAVSGSVLIAVIAAATVVRRLFGYSFATWRFHLRGEVIRSAHDIGWVRELTVGRLMRRDLPTVASDMKIAAFRRAYPLGSATRVIAVDGAQRYDGLILVAEAHAASPEIETVAPLLRLHDTALLPAMNAKEAMALFEQTEAEALVVVDKFNTLQVIGLLTEAHLLRRYGQEVEKRRSEEGGLV